MNNVTDSYVNCPTALKSNEIVSQAPVVVVVAATSAFAPDPFSNFKRTGMFATGDHTVKLNPFCVVISMLVSKPKFTPAKAALAGTVFSATVAEVFAPDASGLAIA